MRLSFRAYCLVPVLLAGLAGASRADDDGDQTRIPQQTGRAHV